MKIEQLKWAKDKYADIMTLPASRFELGRGDIGRSFSTAIAPNDKIKNPFRLGDRGMFVCMGGFSGPDGRFHDAWRIVEPEHFEGQYHLYSRRGMKGHEKARNNPLGFYHGMKVWCGTTPYILVGKPILLHEGEEEGRQTTLF